MRRILLAIIGTALLGVVVASYGLWQHYAPTGSSFCNFSATVSCDLVNQSTYSELFGIPIAAIGILGYLAIVLVGIIAMRRVAWTRNATHALVWMAVLGAFFQLAFTYIEFFVIKALCPVCVISQILILIEFILVTVAFRVFALEQGMDTPKMS